MKWVMSMTFILDQVSLGNPYMKINLLDVQMSSSDLTWK